MKLLKILFASLLPSLALAATYTPGPWKLVRSGSVQAADYTSAAQCDAALRVQAVANGSTVTFRCQQTTVARGTSVTPPPPPPPPVDPPPANTGAAKITLSPATYAVGGYSTIIWNGSGCAKSSSPAYSVWDSTPEDDGGRSVAPNVTTTFTLTCANGTANAVLTVTGAAPPADPPPAGGGSGGGSPPPVTNLPVPDVLATPIALSVRQGVDAQLLKYAETARRNWNFEGHVVPVPFSTDQGYWDYENCTTHYAVWLFDRPGAWFKMAAMTGDAAFRDQAVSDFRYWVGKINAQGFFSCKTGEADTKYLEISPFLEYEAATGDTQYRPVADHIYAQSAQGMEVVYSPGIALWTEREVGIHLGAALDYYRLTGNQQALARAAALVRQWTAVAGSSGAPQVSYTQHEGGGPGGTTPANLTNSPWMSAFYFQAARRYWQITGDPEVLHQASRYFDWLTVNGLYDGSLFHPEFSGVTVPRYLTGELIGDAGYDEGNLLHCPDVQGLVAFAVDAKRRLGESTTVAESRLAQLQACSTRMYANWTRDGGLSNALPKYRIQAPRIWNWWLRGIYEGHLQ